MNNLTTLIILHTFMRHFLVAISSILVHLMTFYNPVTTSKSSLSLSLVSLSDRIPKRVGFGRRDHLHLSKPSIFHSTCVHLNWFCHLPLHIVSHACNHFVNLTERLLKERVIGEWIPKVPQHRSHSEVVHHFVCHLLVSSYHLIEGRSITASSSYLKIVVCATVIGLICHCEGARSFLVWESHWASLTMNY